jgi:TetR/AcrR family transcriptional regulator, lmrAB and yxaGH operons repressor
MKELRERRSRDQVVRQLREVFRRFGYDGATLTRISDETGLGRASLYHHFPNGKDEMVRAVLEQTELAFDTEIISRLRGDLPPEDRIRSVLDYLSLHYQEGSASCFLGVLALTVSEDGLRAGIRRVFEKWIAGFTEALQETGISAQEAAARAEDAVVRMQGSLVLARATQDPTPFQRVILSLKESLVKDRSPAAAKRRPRNARTTTGANVSR